MSELKIERVWKEYGDQIVLEDVSLTVESRAFVALVGPSGCGKTTFLRMLLGQEQPTKGRILLDGEALPAEPGSDRGVVFQRYSVFPHLTVLGNVLLGKDTDALDGRFVEINVDQQHDGPLCKCGLRGPGKVVHWVTRGHRNCEWK